MVVIYREDGNSSDHLLEDFWSKIKISPNRFKIVSYEKLSNMSHDEIPAKDSKDVETLSIIEKAQKIFSQGPNTLFLGAGVSMSAQLPGWEDLLKKLLNDAGNKETHFSSSHYNALFKECGSSSIVMGRFIQNLFNGDKKRIDDATRRILYQERSNISSPTIETICKIIKQRRELISSVITYNYDDLIEQELDRINVDNYPVYDNNEPETSLPVCHVHGLLSQHKALSSTIVLSEKEYHEIYSSSFNWSNIEQLHALQRTNCFFIGLSMTDPNLRRLLDIAQGEGSKKGNIHHFAFIDKDNIGSAFDRNSERDEYCKRHEEVLKELGVGIIWYDRHENLPKELSKLMIDPLALS